jgi:hypothetical protein
MIAYLMLGAILVLIVAYFVWVFKKMKRGVQETHAFFTSTPKPVESEEPGNEFIESTTGQRIFGLIFGVGGAGATVWIWSGVVKGEGFRMFAAVMFPVFAVLGLSMMFFPIDVAAQRWKYGTAKPRTWNEFPLAMKVAFVLAVLAGVGNLVALYVMTR